MIDIKDIQGNILLSVPITQASERVEELMANDHIQLSWNSDSNEELQAGCYIDYNGERFSLLEPYKPTQKNEMEFTYTPQFKSKVIAWGKTPFFFYTTNEGQTTKEPDWTLTSNPADFMKCVCDALLNETGEQWTYVIDASLPASASLSFSTTDIFSGLNEIAGAFKTEWYADKANNILYLGKASFGEPVTLEVGDNIQVPSVNNGKEGYYTRFYAFGSTRNITQDYKGSNVNNLVNKRLTLDPVKYPNGYKDIREGLMDGEIFSKVLIFDKVYPSSKLSISGVRNRLMYRVDSDGKKIQIGTDESGNPIYDQYAIWYFRIDGFTFDMKSIIEGKTLSVNFQTGALSGREFELKYYEKNETITTSDGLRFEAKAGDYEILFIEESNYIIPSLTGLVPSDGDEIILFNIEMPSEYTQSAYDELEAELDKEIERLSSNLNNYTFNSNPVAFNENNPNLSVGRNVIYKNGSETLSTRVIKLTTKLDFPIEQNITIGNEKIKGNTQQLKEEVATANKDLNLMSVFNDMTQTLQQSYNRTQQMMLEGFASIKNIWQIKEDAKGVKYIFSEFNVATQGGYTQYADLGNLNIPSIYEGIPFDNRTIWLNPETKVVEVIGGTGGGSGEGGVSNFWDLTNIPTWITATKPEYSYGEIKGTPDLSEYAKHTDVDSRINDLINGAPAAYDTLKEIADVLQGNVNSIGDIITTLGTKADKTYVDTELAKYIPIAGGTEVTGIKDFLNGLKVGGLPISKYEGHDDVIYIDANVVLRGGLTQYAVDPVTIPSIAESLPFDGKTIQYNTTTKLIEVIGGTGGGVADSVAWANITGKPTFATVATSGSYNDLSNKPTIPTSLKNPYALSWSGYSSGSYDGSAAKSITIPSNTNQLTNGAGFITSSALSNYLPLSGGTLTGNLALKSVSASDDTPKLYFQRGTTADTYYDDYIYNTGGALTFGYSSGGIDYDLVKVTPTTLRPNSNNTYDLGASDYKWANIYTTLINGGTPWHSGNDGSGSGLDADLLDGKHLSDILASNVDSATKLQTARTIWGQSFDGTSNIKGNLYVYSDTATTINQDSGKIKFNSISNDDTYRSPYIQAIHYSNYSRKRLGFFQSNAANYTDDFVEALSILPNGNIGVNQITPEYKLDVTGTTRITGAVTLGSTLTGNYWYLNNSSTNPLLRLTRSGVNWYVQALSTGLAIGGSSSVACVVDTSGNFLSPAGITQYSDIRKKTKLQDVELTLSQVANAPLIEHYYKSDDKKTTHVGSIAQYWADMNDWFCKLDSDGFYTMEIQNAALASAISIARELERYESKTDKQIRLLKKRINELEDEIEKLKNVA